MYKNYGLFRRLKRLKITGDSKILLKNNRNSLNIIKYPRFLYVYRVNLRIYYEVFVETQILNVLVRI